MLSSLPMSGQQRPQYTVTLLTPSATHQITPFWDSIKRKCSCCAAQCNSQRLRLHSSKHNAGRKEYTPPHPGRLAIQDRCLQPRQGAAGIYTLRIHTAMRVASSQAQHAVLETNDQPEIGWVSFSKFDIMSFCCIHKLHRSMCSHVCRMLNVRM
jgi:hypothetical protein